MNTPRFVALLCVVALGCTADNPNFCCLDPADCAQFGVDETRFCEGGDVCHDHACVPSACDESSDCIDPLAPYCVDHLCEANCTEAVCAEFPDRPMCAADGVCVACIDNSDCAGTDPVCDSVDRTCRGCTQDAECASGVCIVTDGTCADAEDIVYVRYRGSDAGTCTAAEPCNELSYAIGQTTETRNVIRILGPTYVTDPIILGASSISWPLFITGTETQLRTNATEPILTFTEGETITLENLRIIEPASDAVALKFGLNQVGRLTKVVFEDALHPVQIDRGNVVMIGCSFERSGTSVLNSDGGSVNCTGGVVQVLSSEFRNSDGVAGDCTATIRGTLFRNSHTYRGTNARLTFEDNLVTTGATYADAMFVTDMTPDSVIRYNTWACTLDVCGDGRVLSCTGTSPSISSNIFAWNSPSPFNGSCALTYSVLDDTANVIPGDGNQNVELDSIFVSRVGEDFHLAEASVARGAADPADDDVTTDFEGNARPNPAGSVSDAGAFEAP